jgi:hypothetical protein
MDLDIPNVLSLLVDKAFNHYDKQNIKYLKYLNTSNITVDREKNTIIFTDIDDTIFSYEILGIFDNTTRIWMWAWMIPDFMYNETNIVRKLLNYGLKINPSIIYTVSDDRLYLKTQLVNSRFLLDDEFQLDLHLSISSYLAKDNFKFIYRKKKFLNKDETRYISVYYLCK